MSAEPLQGRYAATAGRYGFVRLSDDLSADLFIPPRHTGGALDGDLVACAPLYGSVLEDRREARVVAVLERRHARLTGALEGPRRDPHFVPDPPRLPSRLRVSGSCGQALPGDRVLAELVEDEGGRLPAVRVLARLGDAGDALLDAEIICTEFGLPGAYPPEALAEAERAAARVAACAWEGRRDFRAELAFTIDPADARDHDDAVSVAALPGGGWRLRVHIADVAEAVAEGGALDEEARRRGNSVYLPGRVIPMLPEVLSGEAMSLRPGEPRPVLTLSALVGAGGELRATRVEEGVIESRAAVDYDRAQAVLEGRAGYDPEIDEALRAMRALALGLRERRLARGGFDLVVPECEVDLDSRGLPRELRRRLPQPSTQIIEEFMILANRIACAYAVRRGHPYLFRVHGPPDPRALERFRAQVRFFAPEAPAAALADIEALRRWLARLPPGPRSWQIHALFLRAMQRALYGPADEGHFGLGLRGYAHFTSPIRRYPDLFNHRVVKWALARDRQEGPAAWRERAAETGRLCTETELRAERAEQALLRVKTVRWAEQRLGETFAGRVTATQPAGVYVEFDEAPVDGFLPREGYPARGGPGRRRRRRDPRAEAREQVVEPDLGVEVLVRIARVDLRARRIELELLSAGRAAQAGKRDRPPAGAGGGKGSGKAARQAARKVSGRGSGKASRKASRKAPDRAAGRTPRRGGSRVGRGRRGRRA